MLAGESEHGGIHPVRHTRRIDSYFGCLALAQAQLRNTQWCRRGSYQQRVSEGYFDGWTLSGSRAMAVVKRIL